LPDGPCEQGSAPAASARTPHSPARLSDSSYLLTGAAVFVLALTVQFWLYAWMLQGPVRSGDLEQARPAVTRWVKTALVYQTVVLVASGAYVVILASGHPRGLAWVAPAIGAVIGTALPLQLAVVTIMRTARRL